MREILLRGKSVETNEWVYGSYILEKYGNTPYICYFEYGTFVNIKQVEVIPETVGEFTGMTDKNGKPIFEGDILKNEYEKNKYQYFKVFYCSRTYCWLVENKYGMLGKLYNVIGDIEIIGNIHDNPELLKGSAE